MRRAATFPGTTLTVPAVSAIAWLMGMITLVQVPAAVPAFVPIADPLLRTVALAASLGVTVSSILYVRHETRSRAAVATAR